MIRKIVKDNIWARQKGGCTSCISLGREYYSTNTNNSTCFNTVLLCPQCYIRRKDPEILLIIYEYLYYVKYHKVSNDLNEIKDLVRELA